MVLGGVWVHCLGWEEVETVCIIPSRLHGLLTYDVVPVVSEISEGDALKRGDELFCVLRDMCLMRICCEVSNQRLTSWHQADNCL